MLELHVHGISQLDYNMGMHHLGKSYILHKFYRGIEANKLSLAGILASLDLGRRMIISVDFLVFNMRLLLTDQLSIAKSYISMVRDCEAGTRRYVYHRHI